MLVLSIFVMLFSGISTKSLFASKCRLVSNALNCKHASGQRLTHIDGKVYSGITIIKLSGPTDKIHIDLSYFPNLERITGGAVDCNSLVGEASRLIQLDKHQCYLSPSTGLTTTTDIFPTKPSVFSTFTTPVLSTFVLSTDLSTLSEIKPSLITAVLPTSITTSVVSITPTASLLIPTHSVVASTIIPTSTITTPSLPISLYSTNTISNVTNSSGSTLLIPTNSVTTSTIIPITSSLFPVSTLITPSLAHPTPTIINDDDITNNSTDSHHSRYNNNKVDSVRTDDKQYSRDEQSDNMTDGDDDSVLVNTGLLATMLSLMIVTLMVGALRLMHKHRAWFSRWFTHCHRRRHRRRQRAAATDNDMPDADDDDDTDADGAVDDDVVEVEMHDILAADHPAPAAMSMSTPAATPADHPTPAAMSTPALRAPADHPASDHAAAAHVVNPLQMSIVSDSLAEVEDYLNMRAEELNRSLDERRRHSSRLMMKKMRPPQNMKKPSFF